MRDRRAIVDAAECARWAQGHVWDDTGPAKEVRTAELGNLTAREADQYAQGFEDALRYALATVGANETPGLRWVLAHIFFVEEAGL